MKAKEIFEAVLRNRQAATEAMKPVKALHAQAVRETNRTRRDALEKAKAEAIEPVAVLDGDRLDLLEQPGHEIAALVIALATFIGVCRKDAAGIQLKARPEDPRCEACRRKHGDFHAFDDIEDFGLLERSYSWLKEGQEGLVDALQAALDAYRQGVDVAAATTPVNQSGIDWEPFL